MTSDPTGREDDDRPEPAASTPDDDRPIDDEDETVPDRLDLPIETPTADAIDQQHAEYFDDDIE